MPRRPAGARHKRRAERSKRRQYHAGWAENRKGVRRDGYHALAVIVYWILWLLVLKPLSLLFGAVTGGTVRVTRRHASTSTRIRRELDPETAYRLDESTSCRSGRRQAREVFAP